MTPTLIDSIVNNRIRSCRIEEMETYHPVWNLYGCRVVSPPIRSLL